MNAATIHDLKRWFDEGQKEGALYMIVVCDTYDHDDYPVHIFHFDHFWKKYDEYASGENMQRIMEVYDLSKSWESQSTERAYNTPSRE